MLSKQRTQAFSLVELSIVLVIIGLIVSGILVGQSLNESAKAQKVGFEKSQYETAITTFQAKYYGLPGDLNTAFNYFGPRCNAPVGSTAYNSQHPAYCNGDGDEAMADSGSVRLLAWRHLSAAGMVPGNYQGGYGTGKDYNTWYPGEQSPKSGANDGYWFFTSQTIAGKVGNWLNLAKVKPTDLRYIQLSWEVLNSVQAWKIDKKFDDGMPNTGNVIGLNGQELHLHSSERCAPSGSASEYYYQYPSDTCKMHFFLGSY